MTIECSETQLNDLRLNQQLQFVMEIDKLKGVLRQTLLTDHSRQENSAEHSWHLAIMAMTLTEYAPAPINVLHVMKLVLLHDLVEIDAGDTFCYDVKGYEDKVEREIKAADRIFGLLPEESGQELRALWEEFEAGETTNAQFAKALDCLQPFLHNYHTQGGTWRKHGIDRDRVVQRMQSVKVGMPSLWTFVERIMDESVALGYLKP